VQQFEPEGVKSEFAGNERAKVVIGPVKDEFPIASVRRQLRDPRHQPIARHPARLSVRAVVVANSD
jgi:hypothetical protein